MFLMNYGINPPILSPKCWANLLKLQNLLFREGFKWGFAILVMAMVMAKCGVKKFEDLGILPILEKFCHSFPWFLQHLACENKEKWLNFHKWKCHEDWEEGSWSSKKKDWFELHHPWNLPANKRMLHDPCKKTIMKLVLGEVEEMSILPSQVSESSLPQVYEQKIWVKWISVRVEMSSFTWKFKFKLGGTWVKTSEKWFTWSKTLSPPSYMA